MNDRDYYVEEWGDDVVAAFENAGVPLSEIPERYVGQYAGESDAEVAGSYIYTMHTPREHPYTDYIDWTALGRDAITNGAYVVSGNFVFCMH